MDCPSRSNLYCNTSHCRLVAGVLILLASLPWAGCQQGDPITVYESVPITRSVEDKGTADAIPDSTPRFRMLAAISELPAETWIFKLTGTIDQIAAAESAWTEFLASVRYVDGKPEWKLPAKWRAGEERPMRFATLYTDEGENGAELSVSSLPSGQPIAANVNRWRGQLGLAPLDEQKILDSLTTITGEDSRFLVFDARGPKYDTGMGGMSVPPFAASGTTGPEKQGVGGLTLPDIHAGVEDMSSADDNAEFPLPDSFRFDEPAGWKPGKRSSIVFGRWSQETSAGTVEMSLMNIKPTDESWQLNLQAWGNQVGMTEPVQADAVTTEIKIDGTSSKLARLDGSRENESGDTLPHSALIAMFRDHEGEGWIVKLSGPREAVDQARADFDKLLESITLGHREQE